MKTIIDEGVDYIDTIKYYEDGRLAITYHNKYTKEDDSISLSKDMVLKLKELLLNGDKRK